MIYLPLEILNAIFFHSPGAAVHRDGERQRLGRCRVLSASASAAGGHHARGGLEFE